MRDQTESAVCPACGGVGYRIVERNGIGYAGVCECARERHKESLAPRASVPARFQCATFDNFVPRREGNPSVSFSLSSAFRVAKAFAREYPTFMSGSHLTGLLFTGEPGCGKTHLAVSVLKHLLSRGFDGWFCDYRSLLTQIAQGWKTDAGFEEKQALGRAVETNVLLIDDLGALRTMEWAEDIITEIITERYNSMKTVIVTTNLPLTAKPITSFPNGMYMRQSRTLGEVIGERSKSRLIEMCKVIDMGGIDDYREFSAKR